MPKGGTYIPDLTERRITVLPDALTPGTAYNVRVRAVNWTANGPWSTGQGTPKASDGERRPCQAGNRAPPRPKVPPP